MSLLSFLLDLLAPRTSSINKEQSAKKSSTFYVRRTVQRTGPIEMHVCPFVQDGWKKSETEEGNQTQSHRRKNNKQRISGAHIACSIITAASLRLLLSLLVRNKIGNHGEGNASW